jgi:photosystem II stability/assembly factor-like uncharacterized protein
MEKSGTNERLRAVNAVDAQVVWASGNHGAILRTTDGGETWTSFRIQGTDSLDFRDIQGFSATMAFVMSIGPGSLSRIYKTVDGGIHWRLSFENKEPRAFYDAMAFWDDSTALAVGDELKGRLMVARTTDGGATWTAPPNDELPLAVEGEGAFAASGTCVAVAAPGYAWIGTGVNTARIHRSWNHGQLWGISNVPIQHATPSSGVFSVLFLNATTGVTVGGDYQHVENAEATAAISNDSGMNWKRSSKMPGGYRSCVVAVPGTKGPTLIAVGPGGSDYSLDRGNTWSPLDTTGFHAVSFSGPGAGWAVGEGGRIGRFGGKVPGT